MLVFGSEFTYAQTEDEVSGEVKHNFSTTSVVLKFSTEANDEYSYE